MALILSLRLDAASQEYFDGLRIRYFPPALNRIAAHVTLFHRLPDAHLDAIRGQLEAAARVQTPIPINMRGLRNLGRGVAFQLAAPPLVGLRDRLASAWWDWLSPQDRQKFQPHITVQNKVTPETARATLTELQNARPPAPIVGTGLHLWTYCDGPWEHLEAFAFSA